MVVGKHAEAETKELVIVSLYPRDMNIYGDRGNLLALERRATAYGFSPRVIEVNVADAWPDHVDIVVGGGGQDSGQSRVAADLSERAQVLRQLAEAGTPMLMVCGMYQLFGQSFTTHAGETMAGIGVLDVRTVAGPERHIGNTIVMSEEFGELIGYENHSGSTELGTGVQPLGRVTQGVGNNPSDRTEGARVANVLGTYLHGPLLPKNPAITDFLIRESARRRYGSWSADVAGASAVDSAADTAANTAADDELIEAARRSAKTRPR